MSEQIKGKFVLAKKTTFAELTEGTVVDLPESDLCIQTDEGLLQFKYERPEEETKLEIKPGIFRLVETQYGVNVAPFEMTNEPLLETIDNTKNIIAEARKFFSRLHVYEKRGRSKKRGVLLYSKPGMGKTQAIKKVCRDLVAEDPGTVVFIWPTSEIDADPISRFLGINSIFKPECTRLILVMEDIGGNEHEGHGGPRGVDSGLLDLLDGQGVSFKLPTFTIATTNHPENLLESLADRPGRFDQLIELAPPSKDERIQLLAFIAGHELSEEDKEAITSKGTDNFSVAHISEVVIRADLDDKTYAQVVKEIIKHSEKFKAGFENKKGRGLGMGRYED